MAPRLSVIVPIYNVAQYLPACLNSLAVQTFQDLEVLMIDDGSTDESHAIAAEFAAKDSRFRLIRKENAGLGAARNTGLDSLAPESEFLAFVDSDDMIPPDAYRMMISSLEETGSSFATGNVEHINSTKVWQSPMHRFLSRGAVKRTHVSKKRQLLTDRIACNKIFRRDFWERHAFRFPEGVLYEDTPVIVPAQYLAESVDIISQATYYWRLREGEASPSITQRRNEPKAARDRASAVESVSRFFAEQKEPVADSLKREYDHTVLTGDLRIFLNVLPDGDEEYRTEFLRVANKYLDQVDLKTLDRLPTALRVKWLLVRKHAMAEILEFIEAERLGEPVELGGVIRKYAKYPSLESHGDLVPKKVLRVDRDLQLRSPLKELSWEDGKLRLAGHAWIDHVDQTGKRSVVKLLQLKKDGTQRRMLLPLGNVFNPEATTGSGHKGRGHSFDWAGWETVIDPARFRKGDGWQEGLWHVGMRVLSGGLVRSRSVHSYGSDRLTYPPYQWLDENYRMVPEMRRAALKLRIEKVPVLITGFEQDGDTILLEADLRETVVPGTEITLRVSNQNSGEELEYPVETLLAAGGRTPLRVRVPLRDIALLPEHLDTAEARAAGGADPAKLMRRNWSTQIQIAVPSQEEPRKVRVVVRDGLEDLQIRLPESFGEDASLNEVAVLSGANGYLKFSGRPLRAKITGISESEGTFTIRGTAAVDLSGHHLVVSAKNRFDEKTVPLTALPDGGFEASFRPATMSGSHGRLPLKAGRWVFRLDGAGDEPSIPLVVDRLAAAQFPLESAYNGREYQLEVHWQDHPQLNCMTDLTAMEKGANRQYQLRQEVYEAGRELPLRDSVLYISYNGKQYSDSPRAVHEELLRRGADVEHLWLVRDGQVELPDTVKAVKFQGRDWYEALARSRYIVTNAHLPHWIKRREGQVIVQAWHGTMLKKIGLDIDAPKFDPNYHERLVQEAANWNILVSSNRFSTPILKRAMGYDGLIAETGYPRNDYLYADDRDERAREVREKLGLPEGKKVVLYAPTWRDDLSHSRGQFKFDLRVDLEDARRRLGDDHVFLIRRHSNIVDSIPGAGNGFVYDVSEYPDIADLYVAADIMITDYSSVMFDYAHLRRPMLFFTYDLEHYRDKLRGFYFDFENDAPGPLVDNSDDLIKAIRGIDEVAAEYQEKYDEFHHQFCDLDDGHASARLADLMFRIAEEGAPL
ncbi:glycosyltransferase [Streptomyces sp. adm13(2018)]|uniref:bifunctional glycosyltransferase/CDP-glycerol:glycerophosphate glycerophosphotransferase n=1 Tax=Streptomyces sp. adm13(2018) TaxID=2479007 RepID=UPI0011CE5213|nr:bifunctional glycosyltransferase/CDP-glycerol:glycerophosphate glycerophosphotransferase [Streptomyces sp. adm13(2018)]TXS13790.1 glycosyltransferase [Streptomyces sp. adm13(2018)]